MILPGALAALGYLVFVIALAVFMSLVCSMFGVSARRPTQSTGLVSNKNSSDDQKSLKAVKNYRTNTGTITN